MSATSTTIRDTPSSRSRGRTDSALWGSRSRAKVLSSRSPRSSGQNHANPDSVPGEQVKRSRFREPQTTRVRLLQESRCVLDRGRWLQRPAARFKRRTLQPARPGANEKRERQCAREGSRRVSHPRSGRNRRPTMGKERDEIPGGHGASDDREKWNQPNLYSAGNSQADPRQEPRPPPLLPIHQERQQPQRQQREVGECGRNLLEPGQVLARKGRVDRRGGRAVFRASGGQSGFGVRGAVAGS